MPPDRTLGEMLAEFFSRFRRRRVWRAGFGVVTEIRGITQDHKSLLKGTFQRGGMWLTLPRGGGDAGSHGGGGDGGGGC